MRSYSIASLPSDPYLELHVRRVPGGIVSTWLHDEVKAGDEVRWSGPHGSCFYTPEARDHSMLLAGTGTGLAPLWGILRDALAQGHAGRIDIIQGGLHPGRLYLIDELRDLAQTGRVRVHFSVLEGADEPLGFRPEPMEELVRYALRDSSASPRVFLCGDPTIVRSLQRATFLAGVASENIFADPFLPAPGGTAPAAPGGGR